MQLSPGADHVVTKIHQLLICLWKKKMNAQQYRSAEFEALSHI